MTDTMQKVIQIIGWYGVLAILVAYALITLDQLGTEHMLYIFLNGSGALALIIQTWQRRNWQLVTLNIVWLLVAIAGVVQMLVQ